MRTGKHAPARAGSTALRLSPIEVRNQIEFNLITHYRDQPFGIPIHGLHASAESIEVDRDHCLALILRAQCDAISPIYRVR
jgi:hypothetical protein